jgi:hypothetical protein
MVRQIIRPTVIYKSTSLDGGKGHSCKATHILGSLNGTCSFGTSEFGGGHHAAILTGNDQRRSFRRRSFALELGNSHSEGTAKCDDTIS